MPREDSFWGGERRWWLQRQRVPFQLTSRGGKNRSLFFHWFVFRRREMERNGKIIIGDEVWLVRVIRDTGHTGSPLEGGDLPFTWIRPVWRGGRSRRGSSLQQGQKCGLGVFRLLQPINKESRRKSGAPDWDQSNSPHSTEPRQVSLVSTGQWRVRSVLRRTNTGLDLTEGPGW